MNYLTKYTISAIENQIYSLDSYQLGVVIGNTVNHLVNNNIDDCNAEKFLEGINKGFQKANVQEITQDSK